jgi:NAD(P)-dependent dehydrogenase (short-subunit alcohol dehydrogenase family)
MTPQHGCAWITGASSGIGAALALELAQRGWVVAISARRADDLEKIAAQDDNIHSFICDVTDRAAMAETVSAIETELGPIALGVMNAGIYLPTALPKFDASVFDRTFEVNLTGRGMFRWSRRSPVMAVWSPLPPMARPRPLYLIWANPWRWI